MLNLRKIMIAALVSLLIAPLTMVNAASTSKKDMKLVQVQGVETSGSGANKANTFNRLLKKDKNKNAAPWEDGIHDPENDNSHALQPPKVAYEGWPKTKFGNYVNWVTVLDKNMIRPRYDKEDSSVEPLIMDLDIVRKVTGSMPDVVFPHRQHTVWLHCSNCHPAIFVPKRNANQINMAQILLGQKCGVCHGKVSFPVSTPSCRLCHSKDKPKDWKAPVSEASKKNPWR